MMKRSTQQYRRWRYGVAALGFLVSLVSPLFIMTGASAAVSNPAPAARVSFTFDDGLASALTQAQPTLTKYGLTGTDYVITGCVGMSTAPNTCHANTDASYMTWQQISQLQAAGWEIGSHTATHPYLASSDASDGQPNVLTQAQVVQELTQSKADLAAHGITATDFSTPYGDYTNATLAQIAKLYATHRGFADQNNNVWPYNDYLLNDFQVQAGVSVANVKAKIDAAISGKHWLVLTFHDIKPTASSDPDDYEYSTAKLDQIAAYVKSKQTAGLLTASNVNQGPVSSDTNLITNASFDQGISGGWTTDAPGTITKDTANNGSFPNATNAAKLVSTTANTQLFSTPAAVDPTATYMFKSFLNVQNITSGEVGFYVDEYDANGNWISGQYKGGERNSFVETYAFQYKPTSANVAKARLQVIVQGNSGITAYLDNVQWFPLTAANPSQPPTSTNLMTNGNFDAGITGGWTTDDATNIKKDTTSKGSPANPVNSIALTSVAKNTHLFSPKIAVTNSKSYTLQAFLRITAITNNEVGFYIDEYDSGGNWISGQYKPGLNKVAAQDVTLGYTPSSANVKSASLQTIVVANSGTKAFIDDIRWFVN